MSERYLVVDTNVLISAALFEKSSTAAFLSKVVAHYTLAQTEQTWAEFQSTLNLNKFDKFVSVARRSHFSAQLARSVRFVSSQSVITDCRDPKDNKFLALALDAQASHIVTGDKDLLVLNPYRGITICNPGDFLASGALE